MKAAKDKPNFLSDWFVSRIDHSTQDPNVGFVETLYQTCSAALIYLWKSQFRSNPSTLHKRTLQRDVESLRLWAENFPSEHLDEILGESSDLKINVLENLTGIGKILVPYFVDCEETRKGRRKEKNLTTTLTQELETQLEKAMLTLSAEERSDSSSDDEISDDSSSPTERQENRLGRLHCYISCLVDLAPVIEKNVSCLYRKVETQPLPTENMFRLSHEAQPYAMRIRDRSVPSRRLRSIMNAYMTDRFVNASIHLIERLAEANWERSIRIRAQQEEGEGLLAVRDAQTFFKPYSIFHDSGIGSSIPTVSQYAATVASHTSFLSIAGEDAHGRPRVPPLSQEYTRPFECDYCGRTVSMRNRIEWK
ncbi:hypothetical protein PENSUB_2203 [Penicillium subrubescens]|uniref:Oxidoreductase acuF-like C2H2 type zinc-finger domain-containing protein n=1 Tax=Penicillium subrubescens TaxID=1316194 RepID=A0A1Q5URQ7_9EURO|nr:hypothetical protein PENSUB_2203 [Penicillium subrubescens]